MKQRSLRQSRQRLGEGQECPQCNGIFCPMPGRSGKVIYCSTVCRRRSIKESIQRFHRENPDKESVYRIRSKQRGITLNSKLERLWKKYPSLPKSCQSCGESRVLDIAHKPGYERNGRYANHNNCQPNMIWVLCPRCHALVDRLRYTAEQLGIKE